MTASLMATKIALEAELVAPMLRTLRSYVIARLARPLANYEMIAHHSSLERVLVNHYARVVMVATGQRPAKGQRLENAVTEIEHYRSLTARARYQAYIILQSVNREVARRDETKGIEVKKEGIGAQILAKARAVMARIKARVATIVNAQTNPIIEQAREFMARKLAGNHALYKEWSTMRDHSVRDTHIAAEGQVQLVSRPFTVGESRLMFPGDTSLGPDMSEVYNCRCSAQFFTRDAQGNRTDLAATERLTPVAPRRPVRVLP